LENFFENPSKTRSSRKPLVVALYLDAMEIPAAITTTVVNIKNIRNDFEFI